jgi:uncharacterized protein YggT (Ycf19 family)
MTHREHDHDHDDPAHSHAHDDTRVLERERVIEERPVAVQAAAPVSPGSSNVNVTGGGGYGGGYVATAPGPLYYARRVVSLLFGILVVLIALRIFLLLFGANEGNVIVDFIYGITEPFVLPFRGIFAIDQVFPVGRSVFDVAAVVALVGWTLIYALIMAILSLADRNRPAAV